MFRSNLHQKIPCKGGDCKISTSMKNCICRIMHALRCDWEGSSYVFYFHKWPVELRIPFRSISRNMNEAFISSLIGMNFHKRFCYGELPKDAVKFFFWNFANAYWMCKCVWAFFCSWIVTRPKDKQGRREGRGHRHSKETSVLTAKRVSGAKKIGGIPDLVWSFI